MSPNSRDSQKIQALAEAQVGIKLTKCNHSHYYFSGPLELDRQRVTILTTTFEDHFKFNFRLGLPPLPYTANLHLALVI